MSTATMSAPVADEARTLATAEHEARHAAMAIMLGVPLLKVTTIPDLEADTWGSVHLDLPDDWGRDFAYKSLLMTLAGALGEDPRWPPPWPLPEEHWSAPEHGGDERTVKSLVKWLKLDEAGWRHTLKDLWRISAMPEFWKLERGLTYAMQHGCDLDSIDLKHVRGIVENRMEHLLVKASAVTTDRGEFEAIASTWERDREGDTIRRGAFAQTIREWRASGKRLPLLYDHKSGAENVIGDVDPFSMLEVQEGLRLGGRFDLEDSELARETWRSVKAGRMSLSFGFLGDGAKNRHGGRELTRIDVFEVTITPSPMNAGTRFLSVKAAATKPDFVAQAFSEGFRSPTQDDLIRQCRELGVPVPQSKAAKASIRIASFDC